MLVTGGAGFVGSHIADALRAGGHDVRVLDTRTGGDVRDADAVERALAGVDHVCHQAGMVGLGVDFLDVADYVSHNDFGTAVLLRALARRRFRGRLVLASSMVVYGEGRSRCATHGTVQPAPRTRAELDARLAAERLDPTLPPRPRETGLIHPISRTMEEIAAIFGAMGFAIAEGPDVENDWHNFGALNIPAHHPARADHDTFYLPAQGNEPPRVLRTHTSPVQARAMLTRELPFRVIAVGRTYRADHDATHSPMFH